MRHAIKPTHAPCHERSLTFPLSAESSDSNNTEDAQPAKFDTDSPLDARALGPIQHVRVVVVGASPVGLLPPLALHGHDSGYLPRDHGRHDHTVLESSLSEDFQSRDDRQASHDCGRKCLFDKTTIMKKTFRSPTQEGRSVTTNVVHDIPETSERGVT